MSNQQNDTLRERLFEEAIEIVQMMIDDKEISIDQKETMEEEIYNQLWEERDFSIEAQMDDDSGDDF